LVRPVPEESSTLLVRTPLLADAVAQKLRREISSGRYKPSEKLPTERELSERYGVSRSIIREALGRLKQDGLVTSRQGSGAFVAEGGSAVFRLDVVDLVDTTEMSNIVELLIAFESAASGHAAQRRTRAELAAIQAEFDAMDRAIENGLAGVDEDIAFHRAIIAATHNPVFRDMSQFLDSRVRTFIRTARTNSARFQGLTRQVQEEHRLILDAIRGRDEDAARLAAASHLRNAAERLVKLRRPECTAPLPEEDPAQARSR
jgi:GntR family transcriptional regulator, transcriptional repressor for pyruvate dehydrogenase complex